MYLTSTYGYSTIAITMTTVLSQIDEKERAFKFRTTKTTTTI